MKKLKKTNLAKKPRTLRYVDGYVLPVPKRKVAEYCRIAKIAAKVWKEHGALEVRECCGEDLSPNFGINFPKIVKPQSGETIFFSWIVFKSRTHRDRVNAKVMQDKRLCESMDPSSMPFDCNRISVGGFEMLVDE